MKHLTLTISLTLITCLSIFGQKLTLEDLTNLCSKKNWEDVNQTLLTKGWEYYDSEKGNTFEYNTITWSFNKDYYNDKAQGWLNLYTYEGFPNMILYTVFNKESYSLIQNSISSAGFKLVNSEIEDNKVISTYGNSSYTLKVSTEKRNDDDWNVKSLTAYKITLIKKAGIYDPLNGKKKEYYNDGIVESEYTLLNGKINGQLKVYNYNGTLKKVGNFTNGTENGLFKEYDDLGNIETEYTMSNGEMNGTLKVYNYNGTLKKVGNFTNGTENGLFKEYDDDGNIKAEYTMSNGEFNGAIKNYYSNGKLKISGNYLKGKEHGNFVQFDEYGNKEAEYVMANGMKNGVLKIYEGGKILYSKTFKDDFYNGEYIEFKYNNETGKLELKLIGEYLNNELHGTWKLLFIEEDNMERLLTIGNYTEGVKNGFFQEIKGDSLIICSYKNDELHGEYRVFRDFVKTAFGGVIRTDISKLILINEGSYSEGLESGYWKNYDLTGNLLSEGRFLNGKKTGEWKYYYTNYLTGVMGNSAPYSKQLFLVLNYSNDQLDGKATRYSYLEEEEYPCYLNENEIPIGSCKRFVYQKVLETTFYKNDKRNGPFEIRDSLNEIFAKGFFKDDLKDGEWYHRYSDKDGNDSTYFIYQKGNYSKDLREGKWIQYYTEGKISETFNYKNGELHGEYIEWNQYNQPKEKKQFVDGKLTELIIYDSLGVNPQKKFEIYDDNYNSYKCRKTDYFKDGYVSQEYWFKKEEEINHNLFEITFLLHTDKKLSDGTKAFKDGVFKVYYSDNQPFVIGKYYKEDRIGLWTFYLYNQNVKIESNFSEDKQIDERYYTLNGDLFSGEVIYVDLENGIKEKRKIKDGLRNGKTTYINLKTNKTIKKESFKNGEPK